MTKTTPKSQYQKLLKSGKIKPDPMQGGVVEALEELFGQIESLNAKKSASWVSKVFKNKEPAIKGLYVYGGVGRGKSMLMDLFYDTLPISKKRRVHFHEFMIEVHDFINAGNDQTLPKFAQKLAKETHVLCFDEFHVTNIADAMILGRLFTHLFKQGLVVVATSNWAPDDLYKNGLQRDRFLPFIELLKNHVDVVHLDSEIDYRTQKLLDAKTYFYPLKNETQKKINALYQDLTDHGTPYEDVIEVRGREVPVKACGSVAQFSFAELCEKPLGAEDYLQIAKRFDTVFLLDVPELKLENRNEAKRFITLIDAFYEAKTRVIIHATKKAQELYKGEDHGFEFERTVSRLLEMQSNEYLKK